MLAIDVHPQPSMKIFRDQEKLTRRSRLAPLFFITGNTLAIFVNTVSPFRISMYSSDSRHWMSSRVNREFHFQ
jgi:hypothetical protein